MQLCDECKRKGMKKPSACCGSPIMIYFAYDHLPKQLQKVSKSIGNLAKEMDSTLPDCAEKSAGLRKLLEAKDCLVRASLVRASL